jgi:hypothetical protein
LRRRMDDRPDVSIIQPATAVHPESRLRQDPSGTTTSRMGGGSSNTLHNHSAVPWLAAAP